MPGQDGWFTCRVCRRDVRFGRRAVSLCEACAQKQQQRLTDNSPTDTQILDFIDRTRTGTIWIADPNSGNEWIMYYKGGTYTGDGSLRSAVRKAMIDNPRDW